MSSIWGKRLKVAVFGESHGPAIGVTVDGFPAGIKVDETFIAQQMQRRAPGGDSFSTKRSEGDQVVIQSGVFNGYTTGAPLCGMIFNTDTRSGDYARHHQMPRPGHADYTGQVRYKGYNDYQGGGHFSGRLTAPLVFAGALCKLALKEKGIQIGAHALQIGAVKDLAFNPMAPENLEQLEQQRFGTLNPESQTAMLQAIEAAGKQGDSLGGIVECAVTGVQAGMGSPIFDTVEGNMASMLFSIPAVKGVAFGSGFAAAERVGSQHNDDFILAEGKVTTRTNHSGGVQGGITNGLPLVFTVAFKPTPSIYKPQTTVDLEKMETVDMQIKGRHDPCIVPRAIPVVEAGCAIVLLDLLEGCK